MFDSLLEDGLLASELKKPIKEVFLAIRTDGLPDPAEPIGDGTRYNPYDASTARKFNRIFSWYLQENVVFRLGPGLFRTEGADGDFAANPLLIRSGTRIVGAGMFNTTLRLTIAPGETEQYRFFPVITSPLGVPLNNVVISDLTIDCNLGDQPLTPRYNYSLASLGAFTAGGSNNLVQRVRVINFGTRTPFFVNGVSKNVPLINKTAECFLLFMISTNAVIEDCVFEQPFGNCARETTITDITGPQSVVRNNLFDGAFVNPDDGFVTPVEAVEVIPGTPATIRVKTRFPHNVWVKKNDPHGLPDWIELKGSELSASLGSNHRI